MVPYFLHCFDIFRLVLCHTQGIIFFFFTWAYIMRELLLNFHLSHTVQFGRSASVCLPSYTEWHLRRWYLAVHKHQNTTFMFWTRELECTCTVTISEVNAVQGRNKVSSFFCTVIAAQKNRSRLLQDLNKQISSYLCVFNSCIVLRSPLQFSI